MFGSVGLTVFFALLLGTSSAQDPRQTIPEAIAAGAVGGSSTVPSGPPPSVQALLAQADLIVTGIVGPPRSYLSDDQRDVYTDYLIANPIFRYQSKLSSTPTPGTVPSVVVTQLGGTVTVNGVQYTQLEPALPPLHAGTTALFVLHRVGNKYFIVGRYFGVFAIADGR